VAVKYFDRNGTTAGFGTFNAQAWDTTTASWSDSAAGTATPTAYTFTNADTAQFGATGATATAGTVTISTGVSVTVNNVTTQNVAAVQNIAAAGTGTLTLAGTTPAIDVQSAGGLSISAPIAGTGGFTKSGAGNLTINATTARAISGPLIIASGGEVLLGSASGAATGNNALANITSIDIGVARIQYRCLDTFTEDATLTGVLNSQLMSLATSASITSDISGYLGQFILSSPGTKALSFSNLPTAAQYLEYRMSSTTASDQTYTFTHSTGGTCPAAIRFNYSDTGTLSANLNNNAANGIATTFSGNVTKIYSVAIGTKTVTFSLGGSNDSSTLSGVISEGGTAGALSVAKTGTGKWALTAANTYVGTTSIGNGTLSAQSSGAFGPDSSGSGGAISVTGGTLELSGGITLDKSGLNISTVTTASPTNAFQVPASGGDNTLEVGSITLNSTIRTEVGTGGVLRLANTGAISGSTFGITKEGAGELDLNAASNTYTGAVAINAGTLTVSTGVSASNNGPLGNASSAVAVSGTLKFDGTSNANISRSVQLTGSTPALEASGTGHIHFSNVSQASGSRTLTLKGTSTTTNQLQSALGNGSGGTTSLTKDGAGQWLVTGTPTYTGATTVNAGTLDFGGQTLSLSGGVAMAGGTLANGNIGDTLVSAVTFTGGTVIALLDSTSTVTATSGTGRLQPLTADGSNSYTGNTTVQSGATLELVTDANPGTVGDGKVTGASNVTVTGTLATGSGVNQRGQCRYGGNLTFAAGSVLAIGAAA
jgi:fibronectin-binding autotransporter adhesin